MSAENSPAASSRLPAPGRPVRRAVRRLRLLLAGSRDALADRRRRKPPSARPDLPHRHIRRRRTASTSSLSPGRTVPPSSSPTSGPRTKCGTSRTATRASGDFDFNPTPVLLWVPIQFPDRCPTFICARTRHRPWTPEKGERAVPRAYWTSRSSRSPFSYFARTSIEQSARSVSAFRARSKQLIKACP